MSDYQHFLISGIQIGDLDLILTMHILVDESQYGSKLNTTEGVR